MVVVDPISNLADAGILRDARTLMTRLIDFLKTEQITAVFTSLTAGGEQKEQTEVGISSLIDTWLLLRTIELGGERNRVLYVIKSRGMAHSNQVREFLLTPRGIDLLDVYSGADGVLTGSMRLAQEARARAEENERATQADVRRSASESRRRALEAQIAAMRADLEEHEAADRRLEVSEAERRARAGQVREQMARSRKADGGQGTVEQRARRRPDGSAKLSSAPKKQGRGPGRG